MMRAMCIGWGGNFMTHSSWQSIKQGLDWEWTGLKNYSSNWQYYVREKG